MKLIITSLKTIKEIIRSLDKLFTLLLFFFDHQAMSAYLNRWHIAKVGKNTFIAPNSRFDLFKTKEAKTLGRPIITIGTHCIIAEYCQFITHDTSLNFFRQLNGLPKTSKWGEIIIKNNVYVGSGSIILPGVTIHENSLIGAGSVVIKDVEPSTVVAGNPAKKITTIKEYLTKHLT